MAEPDALTGAVQRGPVVGADGLARCGWGASNPDYVLYHDTEWGRAVLGLRDRMDGGLDALVWSFAPDRATRPAPRVGEDVPATTPESIALSKALKKHNFVFVGPTTAYAAMQACGLVDDHLAGCHARGRV